MTTAIDEDPCVKSAWAQDWLESCTESKACVGLPNLRAANPRIFVIPKKELTEGLVLLTGSEGQR